MLTGVAFQRPGVYYSLTNRTITATNVTDITNFFKSGGRTSNQNFAFKVQVQSQTIAIYIYILNYGKKPKKEVLVMIKFA